MLPIEPAPLSMEPGRAGLGAEMVEQEREPAGEERVFQAVLHPSADIRNAPSGAAKLKFQTRQSVRIVGRLVPDAEHGDRRMWFEVALEKEERGYIHQMFLKSVSDHRGPMTANTIGATIKRQRRQANEMKIFAVAVVLLLAILSLAAWGLSGR